MRSLIKSFQFALNGILYCIRNERNIRIHLTVMLYVFVLSGFFRLSHTEWILIILTVALVVAMEIINTAIETIVNLLSPNYDQLAKIAKDAAAGGVLVSAIAAVAVGILIFWDIEAFQRIYLYFAQNLWALILFALSIVFAGFFIFGGPNTIHFYINRMFRRKK